MRIVIALCLTVVLFGCGSEFISADGADAGTGGTAGATNIGGNAGEGGGTAGTTSTGGNAGAGGTGTAGEGGQGGMGGSNPCPDMTADDIATMFNDTCTNLFSSGCGTNNPVLHDEFIKMAVNQVPQQMPGYTPLLVESFQDVPTGHPAFSDVDQAVWLKIVEFDDPDDPNDPPVPFFQPSAPTTTCFAQAVKDKMPNPGDFYAVVIENTPDDTVGSGGGAIATTKYYLYNTSLNNPLTSIRLVNHHTNPVNFTIPEPTLAFEAAIFRHGLPTGGGFVPNSLPIAVGFADFTGLNCYKQGGGPVELQLQADPDPNGAGAKGRIGIDPGGAVALRRGPAGTQADNPTLTIN